MYWEFSPIIVLVVVLVTLTTLAGLQTPKGKNKKRLDFYDN